MQPTASFLGLCGRSFLWWLLTNALGAIFLYGGYQVTAARAGAPSASYMLSLLLPYWLAAYFVAVYSLALPLLSLPLQLWALGAEQPWERRGRLLLVILGPFSLLTATQLIGWHGAGLAFTVTYLLACLLAAGWVYRPWL